RARENIYSLTRGDVDLRYLYFVSVPRTLVDEFVNSPSYLGEHPHIALPPHYGAPLSDPTDQLEDMDPDLLGQWWAGKHRMTAVWQVATGKGVTIADCDTGFYTNEADLKFNLKTEYSRDFSDT